MKYKKAYGNCNVPREYEANPSLGHWVHSQRTQYNEGALAEERMQQLNDLEFEWWLHDEYAVVPWDQCLVRPIYLNYVLFNLHLNIILLYRKS